MAFDVSDLFFKEVATLTTDTRYQVIPNGEVWDVISFQGSGGYSVDTEVRLLWDQGGAGEELVASTHGDAMFAINRQFTGDGVKRLAIVLVNNATSAQALGGSYQAVKV